MRFPNQRLAQLFAVLQHCFAEHAIRLSDEGERYLQIYCAVAVRRISEDFPLSDPGAEDVGEEVRAAAHHLVNLLRPLVGKAVSQAEEKLAAGQQPRARFRRWRPAPSTQMTQTRWSITC